MTKVEILKSALKDQIAWFDRESRKHKDLHRRLRLTIFILAASATMLSSAALLFEVQQKYINLAVVIISALVGVVTSIEGLRKAGELWIHERAVYYALKDLSLEVEYTTCSVVSVEDIDRFFMRMLGILGSSLEKWSNTAASENIAKAIQTQAEMQRSWLPVLSQDHKPPAGDEELKLPRDLQLEMSGAI